MERPSGVIILMEQFLYNATGLAVYLFGFVPLSGYLGFYSLDRWHDKWGQNIRKKLDQEAARRRQAN